MPPKPLDFTAVRKLALELPNVQDASSRRGVAFKLGGRLLACEAINKSAEPLSLMVRVSMEERARLLAASPDVFYVTSHYVKYPTVLVRVAKASRDALRNVLASAWMFVSEKAPNAGTRTGGKRLARGRPPTKKRRRKRKTDASSNGA